MNVPMIKALLLDALYQVLDNWVFRILMVLTLLPILMTFIVAFKEDEIVFLFGVERWPYDMVLEFLNQMVGGGLGIENPQTLLINAVASVLIGTVAGGGGIIVTIAATAFFVPRMVEKGAADVLFHKPASRLVLYLSRYCSGLLFVAALSTVMVVGMYLGFLLVSGYSDPGILWAAVTLTYLFGLIHCVSMLVGVVTRSTVASILLTLMFFFGNGCIFQQGWIGKQMAFAMRGAEVEAASDEEEEDEEGMSFLLRSVNTLHDVGHYVLPKTTDADVITNKLRKALERSGPAYLDDDTKFVVLRLPEGVEEADPGSLERPFAVEGLEELYGEPAFAARDGDRGATWTLWERDRRRVSISKKRERLVKERAKHAADDIRDLLEEHSPTAQVETSSEILGAGVRDVAVPMMPVTSAHLLWKDPADPARRLRALVLFAAGDRFYTLEYDAPAALEEDELEEAIDAFVGECGFWNEAVQGTWYESKLGWDSEWKYNIVFSIGSSLAFALVMILAGWWRLSRIDF